MAEDDLELEVEEKSGKTKMIIIIVVSVLLLGAGAAAFFLLSGDDADTPVQDAAEVEDIKEPAVYVGVPEAIISPLKGSRRNRMVQIKVSFMVRGVESEDIVKMHMPRLKNDLLTLVSRQDADVIIKPEGRHQLQKDALVAMQETMTEIDGKPHIEKVLFVSFVMQ